MGTFKESISKISDEFLHEALSSPKLLADMAAMEKYMAESYSGRVFIELLQNADDCDSTKICVREANGTIFFANNGRDFNEEDVNAISRSGASNKERGKCIGYRGIGFKSTSYLTNEIIIYSNNTYFSFSKSLCAAKTGLDEATIPMIRIPIVINEVDTITKNIVDELILQRYKTIFIFKRARISEFIEELKLINSDVFVFLNNIEECNIEMKQLKKTILLQRELLPEGFVVKFLNDKNNAWYILPSRKTALGFKYDQIKNKIIPCTDEEAVYHSYLPTYDKMAFPFKVNADFSTDPSRKHITIDNVSEKAIKEIAKKISNIVSIVLSSSHNLDFSDIFTILSIPPNFSRTNSLLIHYLKEEISENIMLPLQNGTTIKISEYKLFPEWLDEAEKLFIRLHSDYIRKQSLDSEIYDDYSGIDNFIKKYSNEEYNLEDIIKVMEDDKFVSQMLPELQGKIISKIIKLEKISDVISEDKHDLHNINVLTDRGIASFSKIANSTLKFSEVVQCEIKNSLSNSEIEWFKSKLNISDIQLVGCNINQSIRKLNQNVNLKPHISKWRSAEQQCIEIERYFGNDAEDVSKKNLGYDIESRTKAGELRYIEVKSISNGGGFSLTNNEYTAAHQFRNKYYICLMIQNENKVKVIYISNPIDTLHLEKRIKQWEWFCDEYGGDVYEFDN